MMKHVPVNSPRLLASHNPVPQSPKRLPLSLHLKKSPELVKHFLNLVGLEEYLDLFLAHEFDNLGVCRP
jgi:hypothetical protein